MSLRPDGMKPCMSLSNDNISYLMSFYAQLIKGPINTDSLKKLKRNHNYIFKTKQGKQAIRQKDRQVYGQTERQQAGRETDRQTDRWTDRQTDRQTGRQTGINRQRQTDRPTDRQTDRQTDRHTDFIVESQVSAVLAVGVALIAIAIL